MRRPTRQLVVPFAIALAALMASTAVSFGQNPARRTGYTLRRDVDLVVIHATVLDRDGHVVTDLEKDHFKVRENGVTQKLERFVKEAVPITVGLALDNSASMAPKREQMMAAARNFVEVFNKEDEFFVVNFNQDPYLDLADKDFTSNPDDVETAMRRTATRGTTSLYDALQASLEHIRGGTRSKKVILTISDGVDSSSRLTFDELYDLVQQQNGVALYFLVLPCDPDVDDKSDCRRARRQARKLADATGGRAYFPLYMGEIRSVAGQIAHDIRNQYVLGYKPINRDKDGTFRKLEVKVKAKGYGKLEALHRPGYYARSDHQGAQ